MARMKKDLAGDALVPFFPQPGEGKLFSIRVIRETRGFHFGFPVKIQGSTRALARNRGSRREEAPIELEDLGGRDV
jgi:hypothetical protein